MRILKDAISPGLSGRDVLSAKVKSERELSQVNLLAVVCLGGERHASRSCGVSGQRLNFVRNLWDLYSS